MSRTHTLCSHLGWGFFTPLLDTIVPTPCTHHMLPMHPNSCVMRFHVDITHTYILVWHRFSHYLPHARTPVIRGGLGGSGADRMQRKKEAKKGKIDTIRFDKRLTHTLYEHLECGFSLFVEYKYIYASCAPRALSVRRMLSRFSTAH
jgi:hypothetical protein